MRQSWDTLYTNVRIYRKGGANRIDGGESDSEWGIRLPDSPSVPILYLLSSSSSLDDRVGRTLYPCNTKDGNFFFSLFFFLIVIESDSPYDSLNRFHPAAYEM